MLLAQHNVSGCSALQQLHKKTVEKQSLATFDVQVTSRDYNLAAPPGRAAGAIERAHLRYARRLQRSGHTQQHRPVDEETSTTDPCFRLPTLGSSVDALLLQSYIDSKFDRVQELNLAQTMMEGRHLNVMLDSSQPHSQQLQADHTAQQHSDVSAALCLQQAHAAQVARRKLAQAHMWVVFKVVSAYQHQTEVSRDDLVQAGLQGLSTALDKFDPNRGNRLSTLAYTWVREAVGRTYNESACTIKLSERARTNMRKVVAAQQQCSGQQDASLASLQKMTGLSRRTVASALQACKLRELSLEAVLESSTASGQACRQSPLTDQISSSGKLEFPADTMSPNDPLEDTQVAETLIEGALQKLPHPEATVIHHVYGLQDGLPKSRPQVAKLMGTGLHHVRKLEQRALIFLRTLNLAASHHAAAPWLR